MQDILKKCLCMTILVMGMHAFADPAPDFTKLIKETKDAVVSIDTESKVEEQIEQPFRGLPPGIPDIFEHFFDIPMDPRLLEPQPRNRVVRGSGSGFIIEENGYILTNAHVVNDSEQIKVRISNGKEYSAKLIGSDKRSDVALLKIEAENLPVVVMGDSDGVHVGDWVYAIGSPFGFDYTATKGIVSAVARNLRNEASYVPFIQTDAAVNPGNSGGPLFNAKGEVIGITSMIYSRTGTFNGLAFCIPVNLVKNIVDQLKTTGRVSRGLIGVVIQEIDPELAKSFGMDRPYGALVTKVIENGAAEKAGVEIGDIIIEVNGKKVENGQQLPSLVGSLPVNKAAKVVILRGGKEKTLSITPLYDDRDHVMDSAANSWGLALQELGPQQREQLRLDRSIEGVLVAEVKANSPAARAGIRPGDVLLAIGDEKVSDLNQASKILRHSEGKRSLALLIQRNGYNRYIALSAAQS